MASELSAMLSRFPFSGIAFSAAERFNVQSLAPRPPLIGRRRKCLDDRGFAFSCSVSGERNDLARLDVSFPGDYEELLDQAKAATELALQDNKQLLEIEFPTAGLESVPGDGEGGIEMTGSMQLIREFCDRIIIPEKAVKTRVASYSIYVNKSFSLRRMRLTLQDNQCLKEHCSSLII